jgi:metal-responsive CopG/Arc/MetJ family transcriptional regulator
MKKPEKVLITMRIPRATVEQVDKASDGNRSEWIRQAIDEKLAREKEKPC